MALFNTDRLSRSERKKLRELRRGQKAKGLKKRSHSGLTAAESIEKRKLENKRRQARMDDFGKGVVGAAVGGLGAALGGGAALGKLAGKVGSKLGGEAGKKALIDAGKKKLQDFTKKAIARKAGDILQPNQRTPLETIDPIAEARLEGIQDIPLEEESFDDPSSLEQALDDPSFAEFGSEGVDEFPTRPPRGMGMEAILEDLSKRNMPSIQAGPIFNQVTGGRDRLTSGNENVQGRMDDFMRMLGGFNQQRGLAGLGNTFRTGGRIKVKKKY
jgi:hypothetical protein